MRVWEGGHVVIRLVPAEQQSSIHHSPVATCNPATCNLQDLLWAAKLSQFCCLEAGWDTVTPSVGKQQPVYLDWVRPLAWEIILLRFQKLGQKPSPSSSRPSQRNESTSPQAEAEKNSAIKVQVFRTPLGSPWTISKNMHGSLTSDANNQPHWTQWVFTQNHLSSPVNQASLALLFVQTNWNGQQKYATDVVENVGRCTNQTGPLPEKWIKRSVVDHCINGCSKAWVQLHTSMGSHHSSKWVLSGLSSTWAILRHLYCMPSSCTVGFPSHFLCTCLSSW